LGLVVIGLSKTLLVSGLLESLILISGKSRNWRNRKLERRLGCLTSHAKRLPAILLR